jgi:hypothetical protein
MPKLAPVISTVLPLSARRSRACLTDTGGNANHSMIWRAPTPSRVPQAPVK